MTRNSQMDSITVARWKCGQDKYEHVHHWSLLLVTAKVWHGSIRQIFCFAIEHWIWSESSLLYNM